MAINFQTLLDKVAARLEWIEPPPVYIGAAAVALFLDDFGLSQMRTTGDVDCIVPEILSHIQYARLEEKLRANGWSPDPEGPICRYRGPDGQVVDFMPEYPDVLGFAGRWYPDAVSSASIRTLESGRSILLPCVSRLFACKLEAFFDRGIKDPLASEDLEDIAALLDGCSELTDKVRQAPGDLREFVSESIRQVLNNETLKQALAVHLPRGGDEDARERNLFVRLDRLL